MPDLIKALARMLPEPAHTRAVAPRQSKAFIGGGELLPAGWDGRPHRPKWDSDKAAELGYKRSSLVYTGISALSSAAASVPWVAEAEVQEGEWEPDDKHPLSILLKQPNKFTSMQEFIERWVQSLDLTGNALARKVLLNRSGGGESQALSEFFAMPTKGMEVVPSRTEWILQYRYTATNPALEYEPDQVLHVQFPDPEDPYWGMSPLQALARVMDTESEAIEWNLLSMLKRAVADGVFTTKNEITRPEYDEIKQEIREQKQGSTGAHDTWVVGSGFDFKEMSRSPVDMDFIESMKMYRELLLSGLHVPPVQAGFFDNATLANAEVSRRLFWVDAVIPNYLERMRSVFNRSLLPHYTTNGGLRVSYDTSQVDALRDNTLEQTKIFTMLIRNGVPYNEAADIAGLKLEAQPNGNVPFSITTPRSTGTSTAEPETTVKSDSRVIFTKQDISPAEIQAILLAAAQEHRANIEQEFRSAVTAHVDDVDLVIIEASLSSGNLNALMGAYDFPELEAKYSSLVTGLDKAATDGGAKALEQIEKETGVKVPWAEALIAGWLATHGSELIEQLTKTSREGITRVFEMWQEGSLGDSPAQVSKMFSELFALTKTQGTTVGQFAVDLGVGDIDHRDPLLGPKVERITRALINKRAALIGNHQASLGFFEGNKAAWDYGVNQGVILNPVWKTWLDSDDSNVCRICISLDMQRRQQHEPFYSSVTGQSYWIPGEPHTTCRCVVYSSSVTFI